MTRLLVISIAAVAAAAALAFSAAASYAQEQIVPRRMESIPVYIQERRRLKRNKFLDELKTLPFSTNIVPYAVIVEAAKWKPGRTVTVAFLGGSSDLHANIERVAADWSNYANIKFDFGHNNATGQYRTWTTKDKDYKADIRISFHYEGYWSAVGLESRDKDIVKPHEASMNFEGFHEGTPADWEGTVRHEFGHAIGLEHEHQHPQEGCDWRWSDDPGYKLTKGQGGEFIVDSSGKFPGIYRVLGGPPNKWKKDVVDRNLKQLVNSSAYRFGPFDKYSIMKYHFDAWMFLKGKASPCYSAQPNDEFSKEDKARIALYYPKDPLVADTLTKTNLDQLLSITPSLSSSPQLKGQLQRIQIELTK